MPAQAGGGDAEKALTGWRVRVVLVANPVDHPLEHPLNSLLLYQLHL